VALFDDDDAAQVRELLAEIERPVELRLALGPEETPLPGARDIDFAHEARRIVEGIAELSDGRVTATVVDGGDERYPAIAVLPEGEDVGVRYYGLPWGYELGTLIGGVRDAGRRALPLRPESVEALASLDRDLSVEVFVTPT
jgi:alkyl hydroperoxide reductase subunit AhpF